jgi:hypothetical protein
MSLATWKKEFYPKAAGNVSQKSALAHSLRKWRGLTKVNLKKHGLVMDYECLSDGKPETPCIIIDDSSCALCQCFYYALAGEPCATCPIMLMTRDSCHEVYDDAIYGSKSPTKMIKLLEKTQKLQQKSSK